MSSNWCTGALKSISSGVVRLRLTSALTRGPASADRSKTGKATFEPHVNTLKHGPPILFGIGRILKGRAPYDLVSPLHVARSALRGAFR